MGRQCVYGERLSGTAGNLFCSSETDRGNDVIQRFGDGMEVRVILESGQILRIVRSCGKPRGLRWWPRVVHDTNFPDSGCGNRPYLKKRSQELRMPQRARTAEIRRGL